MSFAWHWHFNLPGLCDLNLKLYFFSCSFCWFYNFVSLSNLSLALFCPGYSSCNFVRVNSTLSVCQITCCLVKFLWHSQFESALCLNVCLFVCCGRKTCLANAVGCLCVENMVNKCN